VTGSKKTKFSIVDLSSPEEESRTALRIWIASSEQFFASKTSGLHLVERDCVYKQMLGHVREENPVF
jgi:hypothetical protein